MQVHFQTVHYAPPRRVSLRIGSEFPCDQYEGFYRDSWWTFELGDREPEPFRLVLDKMVESDELSVADWERGQIREDEAAFAEPDLSSECGLLQRTWFPIGADQDTWDTIVVGAGMGGGTLLYALATRHPDLPVLGLEAGPLLFPTHAGNLARRRYSPTPDVVTDLWGLYNDLGRRAFTCDIDAQRQPRWAGKQVFALGGRSLVWGALSPRLSPGDEQQWPDSVIADLRDRYYDRAEGLLNVGSPRDTTVQRRVIRRLGELSALTGHTIRTAPVAVDRVPSTSWQIADGIFSTADIVLDARLKVPQGGDAALENWPPYAHLSELVTRVVQDPGSATWTVHGVNVVDGTPTTHHAKRVVLAAGAIETARIALCSGVGVDSVGRGITEHDMWWVHFQVPAGTPFNTGDRSVKVLSVPNAGTVPDWNLLLELNAELNENRHVPVELAGPLTQVDTGACGAQLVFLRRTPLRTTQRVERTEGRWPGFNLTSEHDSSAIRLVIDPEAGSDAPADLQAVVDEVVTALHGRPLPDRTLQLQRGARGYVGHEVGTMRMPCREHGPDSLDPVVDGSLQVLGSSGLYVCDNSVFPSSPAANPSLTLCALALRLADHLAAT